MMKRIFILFLPVVILLVLAGCTPSGGIHDEDDVIGNDWHVWGMYDFVTVGGTKIAIGKVTNEDSQYIGYDIYADGETQGPLLCEIRCADGGYLPEDLDISCTLLLQDYDKDGTEDIGVPLKNGDILWYVQDQEDHIFTFAGVQLASNATEVG